jgi:hypothetical protein
VAKSAKPAKSAKSAKTAKAAKSAATKAVRGAATNAAKGAAKTAASKAASKAASAGGDRIGRGTRWTEDQVSLLLDTVKASSTAKQGFEAVATQLGKSTGTVQQKYYNLQKAAGGGSGARRRGRPRGGAAAARPATHAPAASRSSANGLPNATDLRGLAVDDLVKLTQLVKAEVERRSSELDAAKALLPS